MIEAKHDLRAGYAGLLFAGLLFAGLAVCASFAEAPPPAASETPDAVFSRTGDRITGRVIAIGTDGVLRMTGPIVKGEVGVRIAGLSRVTFKPTVEDSGPQRVRLTDGSVLAGKVISISPTEVVVESSAAGKVTINRAFVEEIRAWVRNAPPRADFSDGEMEPFKDISGSPAAPTPAGPGSDRLRLAAEYSQDKAVTVQMDFAEGCPPFTLSIFVGDPANVNLSSLRLQWTGEYFAMNGNSDRGCWSSGLAYVKDKAGPRNARLCYDPVKRTISVWINGRKNFEPSGFTGPETGKYITISCPERLAFSKVQLFEGMLAPGEENQAASGEGDKTADRDAVILTNGDILGAENIGLAEGVVALKSNFAEMTIPAGKIGALIFRRSARKTPEANPKAVLVRTARSSFVLDAVELNDTSVVGTCIALGEVRIARAAVTLIRFSAGPTPPAPASVDVSPWTITPPK